LRRKDLQLLSEKRLREAQSLFRAKLYEGSYHLAGLSIECAVKACIAKQTRRFEFPDKTRALKSFDHNVAELIKVAGLQPVLDQAIANAAFATNWNIVRGWRVESRYTVIVNRADAEALLISITNPAEGVMSWLRIHW
jgi:HEPN domain-containing protein